MLTHRKLLLAASMIMVLTVLLLALSHTAYNVTHYCTGTGAISYSWIFMVLPASALGIGGIASATVCRVFRNTGAWRRLSVIAFIAGFALPFVFGPSWRTGAGYLARGLVSRLETHNSQEALGRYLNEVMAGAPANTGDVLIPVSGATPDWLRRTFPEPTRRVEVLKGDMNYLRVRVGGHYLSYGCYVGLRASDLPQFPDRVVSLSAGSNIVVFVE